MTLADEDCPRYDTGTIGGILAMDYWVNEFAENWHEDGKPYISASQKSLIVSILSAGTFFGALTVAPIGDFFGRRWGLIVSTLIFTVGVIFQTAATETVLFSIGRFVAGYGVGLVSALGKDTSENLRVFVLIHTPSSLVSVRISPKMDSWCDCRRLSACYHHWAPTCSMCQSGYSCP